MSGTGGGRETAVDGVGAVPDATTAAPIEIAREELDIRDLIGRGGNAAVYEGRTADGTLVAVKQPHLRGDHARERFRAEAETWSHLVHRHIIRVHGWGTAPEPWIAMERADAGSLDEYVGGMRTDEALWTSIAVAEAVRYAHERGVMHYDLKPENVMLCSSAPDRWAVPKVTDWGLAELLLTQEGQPAGLTYGYAAPEQFEQGATTDSATDIYQLGATVYALLTGRPPVTGSRSEVVAQARAGDWPDPTSVAPALPTDVDRILARALAPDPQERYEDVLLFKRALETLFHDVHVTTTATHPGGTHRRTGVVGATGPVRSPSKRWRTDIGQAPVGAPVVTDGRAYLGTVDGRVVSLEIASGESAGSIELQGRPIAAPEIVSGELRVLTDAPAIVSVDPGTLEIRRQLSLSFTPREGYLGHGDRTYATGNDRRLYAFRDMEPDWQTELPGNPAGPVAAVGADVVVPTFDGTVCVSREDGRRKWNVRTNAPHRCSPAVTSTAVIVGGAGSLLEVDIEGGTERWAVPVQDRVTGVAVADGNVYGGTAGGEFVAIDRQRGSQCWERRLKGRAINPPVVADGTVFVGCTGQEGRPLPGRMGSVVAFDPSEGETVWEFAAGSATIGGPVPVDEYLLVGTEDGEVLALH